MIQMDAETRIFENEKEADVAEANAELATKKARWLQQSRIAEIESSKTAAIRDAEMQRELERKKALAATEMRRGEALSKATVEYEVSVQKTNAVVYSKQRDADVALYEVQRQAQGTQKGADASLYGRQKVADGSLYATEKDAEGSLPAVQSSQFHRPKLVFTVSNPFRSRGCPKHPDLGNRSGPLKVVGVPSVLART